MARKTGSHADITGPAIRQAALRLFASSGYAAVSMREIASAVGVRAGALYLYTPDKQTLLLRLMLGHMEALLAESESLRETEPLARLKEFVEFHISQNHQRVDEVFVAYMELRNLTPENFAQVEALRRDYEAKLEAILQAGVDAGVLNVRDVRITTRALIAMLNGVNTWFREGGALSLDEVQAIYSDLVLSSVDAGS